MKTKVILLARALGASTCLLTAQDNNQRPEGQRPPGREGGPGGVGNARGGPGGIHLLPPRAQEELKLTEEQKKVRKEITTKYDTNKNGRLDKEEKSKMSTEDKEKLEKAGLGKKKKDGDKE